MRNRPRIRTPAHGVLRLLTVALCAQCLGGLVAAEKSSAPSKTGGTATVNYVAPELFSDIDLPDTTTEQSIKRLLPELTQAIQASAAKRLPAGQSVQIKVRDIDLAGRIAHAARNRPRIVGNSLPAIIEFDYIYTPKSGGPAKTGSKRLSRLPSEIDSFIAPASDIDLLRTMMDGWLKALAKGKP